MDLMRAVALMLSAAAALGAGLSLGGLFSRKLDIVTHALPFWLSCALVALGVAILFAAPASRTTLGLSLFAVLVGVALAGPEFVARRRREHPGDTPILKVIQFNVWDRNRDPAATLRWIVEQNADIIMLQEAEHQAAPVIDGLRAHYPYCTPELGETRSPTSILSKVAPQAGGLIAASDLEPRHWGAWALFGEGAEAFTAASMHYRWPFPALPLFRQAQLFADFLDRFDRRRLIVAGDFNLTPWSFALRRQDARLGLRRRTRGLPTWPAGAIAHWRMTFPFAFLPIDHIYAGSDWRTVSVVRGPRLGSDHLPVVAVLSRHLRG